MIEYLKKQDMVKNALVELLNPGFFDTKYPDDLASVIAAYHLGVGLPHVKILPKKKRVKTLPTFTPPATIKDVYFDLLKILYPVTDEFYGVYVHGSYATGDFVESSDFDIVYILKDVVAKDPERLLSLRKRLAEVKNCLLKVDPLQHHGPYVITPKIMENYLESYLPLDVWKEAAPIWGPRKLVFHVQNSEYHNKLWFEKSLEYYNREIDLRTEYDRKRFICMACMIPAVAHPYVTGRYATKDKAIEWMAKKYPKSKPWAVELNVRRIYGIYSDLERFLKLTREVLKMI